MEHAILWLKFLVAAGVVVVAGMRLTKNAELLASAMNWGHAFAGFVILGWATSLPETTISLSAIEAVDSPSLATGNITGSILFNLAILAVLDALASGSRSPTDLSARGVVPLGVFNLIMLVGTLAIALWSGVYDTFGSRVLGVFLLLLYVVSAVYAWREQSDEPDESEVASAFQGRRWELAARCLFSGAIILVAGVWLAGIGDSLAEAYSLEEGFVGTIFLATVSSLPELVTGAAAVRMGLLTMAAGSILGSNIFNLAIIGTCDLLWQLGDGGGHLMQAAVSAEPGRLPRNVAIALAMTVSAIVAKRLQRADPEGRPKRLLAVISLALYLTAVVWV